MSTMDCTSADLRENPHCVTRGLNSQTVGQVTSGGHSQPSSEVSGFVGIHWLRGSLPAPEKPWLEHQFQVLFGLDYEQKDYGFWRYDRHLGWACGAKIMYHSTQEGFDITAGRIAFELPGHVLETMETWDIGMLCVNLAGHDCHATRIDVYYDDFQRTITPRQLYEAVYEPTLFEGEPIKADFFRFRTIVSIQRGDKHKGLTHDEVAFGKRGSLGGEKYLRVYDKYLELLARGLIKQGERAPIRWELETCDGKAQSLFKDIVAAFGDGSKPGDMIEVAGHWIGGCVDFRKRTDRAGDKNVARCERYEWWQRIVDVIGYAKLVGKRIVKTIEGARQWVETQVVGTLQMLNKALGDRKFIPHLVEVSTGTDRLRESHRKVLAAYVQDELPAHARFQARYGPRSSRDTLCQ